MNGKWIRFPAERRIVLDILAAARTVPAFPVDRWFHLERVRDARHRSMHRISWMSIFLRGWGLTCQQVPDLRRIYLSFPWGHFYEHPQSVASVSVHRREPNASADQLIFSRIMCPEGKTLLEIQSILDAGKRDPIPQAFPDGERLKHMPWPIRRLVWMLLMRVWGKRKAKTIGTFTISSLAGQNASNHFHPLVATTSLSYSPLDEQGRCLVTLLCDHRVIDGYLATEALNLLDHHFANEVLNELESYRVDRMARDAATRYSA